MSGAASSLCREAAVVSGPLERDAVSGQLRTAPGPAEFLLEFAGDGPGMVECYFFCRLWISSRYLEQLNCTNFIIIKSSGQSLFLELVITELRTCRLIDWASCIKNNWERKHQANDSFLVTK